MTLQTENKKAVVESKIMYLQATYLDIQTQEKK